MGMARVVTKQLTGQGGTRQRLKPEHSPDHLFCISLQESLRIQEQAALEPDDGEGLQQTLRDLAQVHRKQRGALQVDREPGHLAGVVKAQRGGEALCRLRAVQWWRWWSRMALGKGALAKRPFLC